MVGARRILRVSGSRDERVGALADAQRGRVSRRQLIAAGLTAAQIGRLIERAQLRPLHHGVYAVGHLAPIELADETAALLAGGRTAVLSHHTAAAMWNLRPPQPGPVHVTVTVRIARPNLTIHRTRRLEPADVRIRRGLSLTSPARTLLDLADHLTPRELERAADEARIQRLTSPKELEAAIARGPHRNRIHLLTQLLDPDRPTSLTVSHPEECFLALVRAARLPPPQCNVHLHGFSVDFYWPESRVAVEIDGYRYHSSRAAFERDHRKTSTLKRAGIDVERYTAIQIEDEPTAVVANVAQALARAA